jgi:hypothetical protein
MDSDKVRKRVNSTSGKLLHALAREREIYHLYNANPRDKRIARRWKNAQQVVEHLAQEYAHSIRLYLHTVERSIVKQRRSTSYRN